MTGEGFTRTLEGVRSDQVVAVDVSRAGAYEVAAEHEGFVADPVVVQVSAEQVRVVAPQLTLHLRELARAGIGLDVLPADELPPEVDLADADLSGARLTGDLSGRDLSGASLAGANLTDAHLAGVRLSRANLFGANLAGADLSHADLTLASLFFADLRGARLVGADLRLANLTSANLSDAIFTGEDEALPAPPCGRGAGVQRPAVRLDGARLSSTTLSGARLRGADLAGADLSGARLAGADLAGACLREVSLSLANAPRITLRGADLRGALMIDMVLAGADLRGADLTAAALFSAILELTDLGCLEADPTSGLCRCAVSPDEYDEGGRCADPDGAGWGPDCACRTRAAGVSFSGAILAGARFAGAHLSGASFAGAAIGDAPGEPVHQPFDCHLPEACADWLDRGRCVDLPRPCMSTPTSFADARLDGAELSGHVFHHVDLRNVRARRGRLAQTRFSRSLVATVDFSDAEAEGMDLSGGRDLSDSRFAGASMRGANFAGATLRRADFSGADLAGVDLSGLDLREANLGHLELVGSNLRGSRLEGADLTASDLSGCDLSMQDLTHATFTDATLTSVDLSAARLRGAVLVGADLSAANLKAADLTDSDLQRAVLSGADLRWVGADGLDARGAHLDGADLRGAAVETLVYDDTTHFEATRLCRRQFPGDAFAGGGTPSWDENCALDYVRIPAGEFWMGSPLGEPRRQGNETRHRVRLTRPYLMQRTELSQAQWSALVPTNPSVHQHSSLPVEHVTWWSAMGFANVLSASEGLPQCYELEECGALGGQFSTCTHVRFLGLDCRGYRLPTEAEWEHAARAGTETAFHSGDPAPEAFEGCPPDHLLAREPGWHSCHRSNTELQVGTNVANAWGLHDMAGNVAEWTQDLYTDDYGGVADPETPVEDPLVESGLNFPVARGGHYASPLENLRSARREAPSGQNPNLRLPRTGFRLVRTIP